MEILDLRDGLERRGQDFPITDPIGILTRELVLDNQSSDDRFGANRTVRVGAQVRQPNLDGQFTLSPQVGVELHSEQRGFVGWIDRMHLDRPIGKVGILGRHSLGFWRNGFESVGRSLAAEFEKSAIGPTRGSRTGPYSVFLGCHLGLQTA